MSFALCPCEVERRQEGLASLGQPGLEASFLALNFRQSSGAQVALLQSPILRSLREQSNHETKARK